MDTQNKLIHVIQQAYSGELGAMKAYRGHWKSVKDQKEKEEIKKIEAEELAHRLRLGEMLLELKARPKRFQEIKLNFIGTCIGLLCRIGGWFMPMYGAGRLESKNIKEYEQAARHAWQSGHHHLIEDFLIQAEAEWNHEKYFREIIQGHFLNRFFPKWKMPLLKETIRTSFKSYCLDNPL